MLKLSEKQKIEYKKENCVLQSSSLISLCMGLIKDLKTVQIRQFICFYYLQQTSTSLQEQYKYHDV